MTDLFFEKTRHLIYGKIEQQGKKLHARSYCLAYIARTNYAVYGDCMQKIILQLWRVKISVQRMLAS